MGILEDVVGFVPFEAVLAALVTKSELPVVLVSGSTTALACATGVVVFASAGGAVDAAVVGVT